MLAVHVPDGFIDAQVSAAAGLVALVGVGACLRRSTADLQEEHAPMAGAVAAFVFAGQMLNFPVAGGTSGHLIGAALATALVGPYVASVCVTAVLVVQALVFADGGLSALGLNIVNLALVAVFVSQAVIVATRRIVGPVGASVLVIGIGEAAITGLTVGAVMAVRPDLVAANDRRPVPVPIPPSELAA
jgi:cobalt/nickel transport system permease protein